MSPTEDIDFQRKLERLLNYHGIDTYCDIPDYIIAAHLVESIETLKNSYFKIKWHHQTEEEIRAREEAKEVKITQENYDIFAKQGKIEPNIKYIIVETEEEQNWIN